MSVVYMLKLEDEPDTYESGFTELTKGINIEIHDWVIDNIKRNDKILEVGCGPGTLALKMANKGASIEAIEKNPKMVAFAKKAFNSNPELNLAIQEDDATNLKLKSETYDVIVSTFMLSELRPFEQQIFLREVWNGLKPNGKLLIAGEFIPSGFKKLNFKLKRWWYKKKLRKLRSGSTHPLKWFYNYLPQIGFELVNEQSWEGGAIRAIELRKNSDFNNGVPGYYQPLERNFKGLKPSLRIMRYLLTGNIDHIPIEPGIYKSGNPTQESPIIVTANYDYTYIRVMRDLKGIDAWVLAVDSRGINVWCAARGNNFGNDQLIEAVKATGIREISSKKFLIMPQLSAGGVSMPKLYEKSVEFPFKIRYGPVWSKDLPEYLETRQKTKKMRLAKFTIKHRMKAGVGHTSFLERKIFLKFAIIPLVILIALGIFDTTWIPKLLVIGEVLLSVAVINIFIAVFIPITTFTRRFVIKGYILGALGAIIQSILTLIIHQSIIYIVFTFTFYYWVGFFSTMSFSGSTMATSPSEIQNEYPLFKKIHKTLLILGIISLSIGVFLL